MFQELEKHRFAAIRPLLDTVPHHLCAAAVADGTCPGRVWADDRIAPRVALVSGPEGHIVLGDRPQGQVVDWLRALIGGTIYLRAKREGWWRFLLSYPDAEWESVLAEIAGAAYPVWLPRQHYVLAHLDLDWREGLPKGMEIVPVDEELLARDELCNIDRLREWAKESFGSTTEFDTRGFGCCALDGTTIASWCLSDCTSGRHAEVGIHTDESYRGRGLATRVVAAAAERGLATGLAQIGWHCARTNVASAATARAVGFQHERDYCDLHVWFNHSDACLANGNLALMEQQYAGAADWFDRAFALPDLAASRILAQRADHARYRYKAACAHAQAGNRGAAEEHLQAALDAGNDRWWGF